MSSADKSFCCIPCSYFCNRKSNLSKHRATKNHLDKTNNTVVVEEGEYQCKNCVKTYKSNQGLWAHNRKCKPAIVAVPIPPETDLHAEIVNLKVMIVELTKNLQSTSITNNNNINNYINIFLNDKCHNACDIKKFIAGIDF